MPCEWDYRELRIQCDHLKNEDGLTWIRTRQGLLADLGGGTRTSSSQPHPLHTLRHTKGKLSLSCHTSCHTSCHNVYNATDTRLRYLKHTKTNLIPEFSILVTVSMTRKKSFCRIRNHSDVDTWSSWWSSTGWRRRSPSPSRRWSPW